MITYIGSVYFIPPSCRNNAEVERPSFCDIAVELQRPDFQILKWSSSDEAQYSKPARTLANPIEKGRGLYPELQKMYLRKNDVQKEKITPEDQPAKGPKTDAENSTTSGQGSSPTESITLASSFKTLAHSPENGDADGYDFVGASEEPEYA